MESVPLGRVGSDAGSQQSASPRVRFVPNADAARFAVRAEGVRKVYGAGETRVEALRGVDVGLEAGQFTAIMGPSGSGKSTLMHCLAGLDTVSGGKVFLGDTDLTTLDDTALTVLRRERIGFVFQSFNLLPAFTAEQNIRMPLMLAGKRRVDDAWFALLIETLGIGERLKHRPSELSGGQQQRVAIARALLTQPDVVFADEPTGNLDSSSGDQVLRFLQRSTREFGQTVAMVTHDPHAASFADRVILMADGLLAGELHRPTRDDVLNALRALGG